jgi:hypothetical protein
MLPIQLSAKQAHSEMVREQEIQLKLLLQTCEQLRGQLKLQNLFAELDRLKRIDDKNIDDTNTDNNAAKVEVPAIPSQPQNKRCVDKNRV